MKVFAITPDYKIVEDEVDSLEPSERGTVYLRRQRVNSPLERVFITPESAAIALIGTCTVLVSSGQMSNEGGQSISQYALYIYRNGLTKAAVRGTQAGDDFMERFVLPKDKALVEQMVKSAEEIFSRHLAGRATMPTSDEEQEAEMQQYLKELEQEWLKIPGVRMKH